MHIEITCDISSIGSGRDLLKAALFQVPPASYIEVEADPIPVALPAPPWLVARYGSDPDFRASVQRSVKDVVDDLSAEQVEACTEQINGVDMLRIGLQLEMTAEA